MNAALDAGPLAGAAARHAAQCERCGRLVRALERGAGHAEARQWAEIQAAIGADLRPVRLLAPAGVYVAAMALALAAVVALGAAVLHPYGWRVLGAGQKAAVFVSLAACAGLLAVWLERQMAPGRKYGGVLGWLAVGCAGVLAGVLAAAFHPRAETRFVAHGVTCLLAGLLFAVPAGMLLGAVLWRGAALRPGRIGAAAGALAGLAGLAVLEIHCPNLNAWHIWLWHGAVTVVCVAAGLAAGRLLYKV
jgi:hypothetical protein